MNKENKDNPVVEIKLTFTDKCWMTYKLDKSIPQTEIMEWMGEILARTDNAINIAVGVK